MLEKRTCRSTKFTYLQQCLLQQKRCLHFTRTYKYRARRRSEQWRQRRKRSCGGKKELCEDDVDCRPR